MLRVNARLIDFGILCTFQRFKVKLTLKMNNKPAKSYFQVFKQSYSSDFPCIQKSRKGEKFAFCNLCRCDINISHAGRRDITLHLNTQKHKQFIKSEGSNQKLACYFSRDADYQIIQAECYFTSFLLEHNVPLTAADHAGNLFRKMFPNSVEATNYACARTKTTAILKEMSFSKSDEIVACLQRGPFSIATDGSNDHNAKLYPVVVTFFDQGSIRNCILSMPALEGDSTGHNIGRLLLDSLANNNIPVENCIAFSCDNAAVMIGHKNGVAAVLKEKQRNIVIVGCPCHLINLAAQKAAACLPVNIDEILVDIYYYLEKSSKRKDKLRRFQNLYDSEAKDILKHVCTRWLSLGRSLTRVVEQWEPLVSFFHDEVKNHKSNRKPAILVNKQPVSNESAIKALSNNEAISTSVKKRKLSSCAPSVKADTSVNQRKLTNASAIKAMSDNEAKLTSVQERKLTNASAIKVTISETTSLKRKLTNATDIKMGRSNTGKEKRSLHSDKVIIREERLFMFLSSDVNKAYSYFLLSMIPVFEKTNVILQSQTPHIHVLRGLLLALLKDIMIRFIKPAVIKQCNSVMDIDFRSFEIQKDDDDLLIGNQTSKVLASHSVKKEEKKVFFTSVRKYFIAACDYITQKFPLKNEELEKAEVANLSNIENASFADVTYFLKRFPILLPVREGESTDKAMDELQMQFSNLQIENIPVNITTERIDIQWSLVAGISDMSQSGIPVMKFDRISRVMLGVLTIPHSNAECERVFSKVKKIRTQFRSSMSNNTLEKLVVLKCRQTGSCYEQTFTKQFLKKAKMATSSALKHPATLASSSES